MSVEDVKKIRECIRRLADWFNANNMYEASKFFTINCTEMPPGRLTYHGREEQAETMRHNFEELGVHNIFAGIDQFEYLTDDVAITSTFWLNQDADDNIICKGKGMWMWKKVDGEWYIHVAIFNED